MLPFRLGASSRAPLVVLCLGAHADDLEIGCAGTLLHLLAARPRVTVHWVVLSAAGVREREARRSAARLLRHAANRHVRIERFRDGFFPHQGATVKELFESLKETIAPDLVFTHARHDAHQDHRVVADLTRQTFRDHCILEYEVPKYDGDLGRPNVYVPLAPGIRRQKVRLLLSAFPSQRRKRWFTAATFEALMRLRGVECAAPEGYAEAYFGPKVVLRPGDGTP